jgi:aminoglycoside 6-adenylyltransferase
MVTETYSGWNREEIWSSLFGMGKLFRHLAVSAALQFGFVYRADEDHKVSAFLHQIHELPPDAASLPQIRS